MRRRVVQDRCAQLAQAAAVLGAIVSNVGDANEWNVIAAGSEVGRIRYDPRARLWLATTGAESTIGDLAGCLQFVIRRSPGDSRRVNESS
jgi:hypothetical protein